MDKAKGLLFEATALTLVAFITFGFTPWLEATVPGLPVWLRYGIPAFALCIAVFLVSLKATSVAYLVVRWHADSDVAIELSQINVKLDSQGEGAEGYWVSAHFERATGLGKFALRHGANLGLRLRIAVPHTSMTMTPELIANDPNLNRIVPGNDCSVELLLPPPVPDNGMEWGSVRLEFQGLTPRPDKQWTLRHTVVGSTRMARAYARLIKVDTKAVSLGENWR
jgi:hypothetical protein